MHMVLKRYWPLTALLAATFGYLVWSNQWLQVPILHWTSATRSIRIEFPGSRIVDCLVRNLFPAEWVDTDGWNYGLGRFLFSCSYTTCRYHYIKTALRSGLVRLFAAWLVDSYVCPRTCQVLGLLPLRLLNQLYLLWCGQFLSQRSQHSQVCQASRRPRSKRRWQDRWNQSWGTHIEYNSKHWFVQRLRQKQL